MGAGALWPHSEAARFDPGDRPAAGPDGVNVDDGHEQGQTLQVGFSGQLRLAVNDQGQIERGATHVDAQQVGALRVPGELNATDGPAHRARQEGRDGLVARGAVRHHPAVGTHDVDGFVHATLAELGPQCFQIELNDRRDVCVHGR